MGGWGIAKRCPRGGFPGAALRYAPATLAECLPRQRSAGAFYPLTTDRHIIDTPTIVSYAGIVTTTLFQRMTKQDAQR